MTYNIITTQPQVYESFLTNGLIARGIDKKIIDIKLHNLHDFALDKHKSIDDTPAGGGAGMVLKVDVMQRAVVSIKKQVLSRKPLTILLTPQGKKFTQKDVRRLSRQKNIILIAGRFEGYDERIRGLVDEEISIGDFVVTSGDLPAMLIMDAISRQVPGFIERKESIEEESFSQLSVDRRLLKVLEYPQYTRPENYRGKKIPEVLTSGNHAAIKKWREEQSIAKTKNRRPNLTS